MRAGEIENSQPTKYLLAYLGGRKSRICTTGVLRRKVPISMGGEGEVRLRRALASYEGNSAGKKARSMGVPSGRR